VEQVVECVELPRRKTTRLALKASFNSAISHFPSFTLGPFRTVGDRTGRQNIVVVQHGPVARIGSRRLYGNYANGHQAPARSLKAIPGVSGSAIVGNGRVALIWMSPALLRDFRAQEMQLV